MKDSAKIDIQSLSDNLIELARKLCWNQLSNSYEYILSEIVNDNKNFHEIRKKRKILNAKKKPLKLEQASYELHKIYPDLYDINFYVYKATKEKTIIEIQYYLKSSLDKNYYEKVKDNEPMLHCKVSNPFYLKNKDEKFDVNWELLGLRYKWNAFVHRLKNKN